MSVSTTIPKLPLGDDIAQFFSWLKRVAGDEFYAFSSVLKSIIEGSTSALMWLHPAVFIVGLAGLSYALHKSVRLAVFVVLSLCLIWNLGYWQETIETLTLVLFATGFCLLLGVPVGIYCAHHPRVYSAVRPVLDLMQTVPTFVYLIPALTLFGLGVVPGLVATAIFAVPAPIRLTYLGVSNVPQDLKEAGQSFGLTRLQLLWRVELPSALSSIAAGVTQCIMLSLSMVVISALVGGDGLGKPVVRALNTVNISQGFEAGLSIVLLAILLDRLCRHKEE